MDDDQATVVVRRAQFLDSTRPSLPPFIIFFTTPNTNKDCARAIQNKPRRDCSDPWGKRRCNNRGYIVVGRIIDRNQNIVDIMNERSTEVRYQIAGPMCATCADPYMSANRAWNEGAFNEDK